MKILLIFVFVITGLCTAQVPQYNFGEGLQCAGVDIDVGRYGSPCVTDWNGDGKKDLLIGLFQITPDLGKIRFYANEGTNDAPVFNSYTEMKADGVTIALPAY